jgi:hypothetical protein
MNISIQISKTGVEMDVSLRIFVSQFAGTVVATLVPVMMVFFLSTPFTLAGHHGNGWSADTQRSLHMT